MLESIKEYAKTFKSVEEMDPILEAIGDAKYVLLGEASHGTSEFYTIRAELTKRLIKEKDFNIIAVEGDWPDCQNINRYIKGLSPSNKTSIEVLKGFNRWPTWMWANKEIASLLEWVKEYNQRSRLNAKIGFYGLDVYSLWESMDEIVKYLKKKNSAGLKEALKAFSCFEPFNRNHESYAVSAGYLSEDCMNEALELLSYVKKNKWKFEDDEENSLNMEVNALVTAHAEEYYRTMVKNDAVSWNIRDQHMVAALNSVMDFYGEDAKVIVWEHNTHVGDARATDMKNDGMINVGQLIREQAGKGEVYIIGFGTYSGSVIASREWGSEFLVTSVPSAQSGSWEDLMHKARKGDQFLLFSDSNRHHFSDMIGHRAIGVVYRPEYEHYGNYVPSILGERYDAFIFIDHTNALTPINALQTV